MVKLYPPMKGKTVAATHSLFIRVLTEDAELIESTDDFAEQGAYEAFEAVVLSSCAGEIVQLIDSSDDRVLAELIVGSN